MNTQSQQPIYRAWAETQKQLPIFMQPWWLDAVCAGKEWNAIIIKDKHVEENAPIVAAMPYLIRRRKWATYILMPQQTQIGGIYLSEGMQVNVNEVSERIAQELQNLRLSYYFQKYPIGSPIPEAMSSHGFKLSKFVTYRIEDVSDLDAVVAKFSKNKMRQLTKALTLHADTDFTPEQFYQFHNHCLTLQKKHITYSREFLLVLERKCHRLGQSQIIVIRDGHDNPHAAALLVWDNRSLYYLIPCYDPTYKDSGAGALLVLEAIKKAQTLKLAFDFEGSIIHGVANHYKQFGSTRTNYYGVERHYRWWFHIVTLWVRVKNFIHQ